MSEYSQVGLQPGQKLGLGRFVLVRKLGAGGMGMVWLARDEKLRAETALKLLPPEVQHDGDAQESLRRETARAQRLSHPNVVRIHDLHEFPDEPSFIAMEYVEGRTLHDLRREQPGGVYSWLTLKPLVLQLCDALSYAHGENVIHRDLKPANILLDSKGRIKLADFGIAAVIQNTLSMVSVANVRSGTLAYMSPQQLSGNKPTPLDDIYSLGATLYHLMTSKPPFYQGDITDQIKNINPPPMSMRLADFELQNIDLPPAVSVLVLECLSKQPGDRPQKVSEIFKRVSAVFSSPSSPPVVPVDISSLTMAQTRLDQSLPSQSKPALSRVVDERSEVESANSASQPPAAPLASKSEPPPRALDSTVPDTGEHLGGNDKSQQETGLLSSAPFLIGFNIFNGRALFMLLLVVAFAGIFAISFIFCPFNRFDSFWSLVLPVCVLFLLSFISFFVEQYLVRGLACVCIAGWLSSVIFSFSKGQYSNSYWYLLPLALFFLVLIGGGLGNAMKRRRNQKA